MRSPGPPTLSGSRTVFGRVFFTVCSLGGGAVSLPSALLAGCARARSESACHVPALAHKHAVG